ncbi:uncharacterized protein DSM5745_02822 [Aspergillus mulundensis]|uniref:Vacuolar ATPase assembly protein VMA22 n=1 Tax=Aspergillus mulundensis TaxID=1810919 RepID=A0A3D8SIM7_9EURO|nr:Uncharacterized protein DSM5745_02822 [Aspergillus mulundensis]RDW86180.1 Uncharacterized protein DSM5745_02822 [Aspergillus mulundensis]
MAQLSTPPASRQSSELPDAELKQLQIDDPTPDLLESLDALLEKYLHLLDKHQRLQNDLASKLSSGFLSLAHANYTCQPGRRYGADYYDERMKASRRVILQHPLSSNRKDSKAEVEGQPQTDAPVERIFAIEFTSRGGEDEQTDKYESSESNGKAPEQELEQDRKSNNPVETTTTPQPLSDSSDAEPEADAKSEPRRRAKRSCDPIRWYGILVPPSLRSAQKSFTEAVEGSLPELAGIVVEMRAAEKEISRLREDLGRE